MSGGASHRLSGLCLFLSVWTPWGSSSMVCPEPCWPPPSRDPESSSSEEDEEEEDEEEEDEEEEEDDDDEERDDEDEDNAFCWTGTERETR